MMIFRNFFSALKLGVLPIMLVLASCYTANSQPLAGELHAKLSPSDQKKLQKIETEYTKGKQTKQEAEKIVPTTLGKDAGSAEKKYYKKREEASDLMLSATEQKKEIYNTYIKKFWKEYKGEKSLLEFVKSAESAASDSFKKAKDNRTLVNKLKRVSNQVQLLEMAENTEARGITMTQKVLYTYLNWPIEYDHSWLMKDDQDLPKANSLPKQADTISQSKVATLAKTADSISVTKPAEVKQTTVTVARPVSSADAAYMSPDAVVKEQPKTIPSPKRKEELVANDSSLYGKVKVNEAMIDRFNKFLSETYPADFEKYIVNFRALDYSDINSIRKAWNVYRGLEAPDSSMIVSNQVVYLIKSDSKSSDANASTPSVMDQLAAYREPVKEDSVKLDGNNNKLIVLGKTKIPTKKDTVKFALVKTPAKSDYIKVVPEKTKAVAAKYNSKKASKVANASTINSSSQGSSASSSTGSTELLSIAEVPVTKGFLFRIQIGACKTSVSLPVLKSIYNGPENIISTREDGWYKYVIGEYSTYQEARKHRDELIAKVPGVFVVAYLSGKRIKITPAVVADKK